MHVCRIAVKTDGAHWVDDWSGGGVECSEPATRCIVVTNYDDNHTETVWLCEAHWRDPHTRRFFEDVWDKVEY